MSKLSSNVPSKVIGLKSDIAYVDRHAVRTIITNDEGEFVLIYVKRGNYYKIPGGGIEVNENHHLAAEREAMEETGCKVKINERIATVEEWRNDLHQISYCYLADLVEDTGKVDLTDEEKAEGLQHEWVSIETALDQMRRVQPTSELGNFIKERDSFLLETFVSRR